MTMQSMAVRLHLLNVEVECRNFEGLVLAKVDPAACLKRMNALISPNPYATEAIEPFLNFDLKRFRITDDVDVVSDLDSHRISLSSRRQTSSTSSGNHSSRWEPKHGYIGSAGPVDRHIRLFRKGSTATATAKAGSKPQTITT